MRGEPAAALHRERGEAAGDAGGEQAEGLDEDVGLVEQRRAGGAAAPIRRVSGIHRLRCWARHGLFLPYRPPLEWQNRTRPGPERRLFAEQRIAPTAGVLLD